MKPLEYIHVQFKYMLFIMLCLIPFVLTGISDYKQYRIDVFLFGDQTYINSNPSGWYQGRLTINNRYKHREFKLKFSALLKDFHLKYAENSKK